MAEEWDIVQVLESEEDAELVAGFLESRGVRCEVESSHSNEFPVTVGTLGVVRLKVPVGQADEARRLLAERDAGAGELPEGTLMDEPAAAPPEGESR
jgi:hypothetical protein